MRKRLIMLIVCLSLGLMARAEATDVSQYENVVFPVSTTGNAGSTVTVSVEMNNAVNATGFQFDIVLPNGITVAKDADGFYLIELSEARTTAKKTDFFSSALQPDGSVRVMCSSTRSYTFSGNKGEVCTIKMNIAESLSGGNYPVIFKNIEISDADAVAHRVKQVEGTLTITKSDDIVVTAKSYTREYGEENPSFEYDVIEGTITSGTPEITCEATTASSVGTYDIVVSKGSVSNNEVAQTNGKLTITKAPLVISVGEYTRQEGEENPEFELSYEGFKNGETDGVLTKLPVVTCSATKDSEPGEYVITIDGAEAENYDIRYAPGKLTVTAKETGIRNVNGNGNDDAYYTLDGKKLDTAPKKGGIYVRKGRLSIKR